MRSLWDPSRRVEDILPTDIKLVENKGSDQLERNRDSSDPSD